MSSITSVLHTDLSEFHNENKNQNYSCIALTSVTEKGHNGIKEIMPVYKEFVVGQEIRK